MCQIYRIAADYMVQIELIFSPEELKLLHLGIEHDSIFAGTRLIRRNVVYYIFYYICQHS